MTRKDRARGDAPENQGDGGQPSTNNSLPQFNKCVGVPLEDSPSAGALETYRAMGVTPSW